MKKVCIIKIGATGDVVRTTTLLHLYKQDEIFWITAEKNKEILPDQLKNLKIFSIENIDFNHFSDIEFDLIISLDDDHKCAELASRLNTKKLFGIYLENGKIVYTKDSEEWFDMGLSSRFGKEKADKLKWDNKKSYQEILFGMLGFDFNDKQYILPNIKNNFKENKKVIGIENRAGNRWPTKLWDKYTELGKFLSYKGFEVFFFDERNTIREYIEDISRVSYMICGDTLAMHIAIGLNIPTIAIFTCTSPQEIYDYGILEKVVSKNLKKAFYKTEYTKEAVRAISLEEVLTYIRKFGLDV
jgi:heptosyltransferase-2